MLNVGICDNTLLCLGSVQSKIAISDCMSPLCSLPTLQVCDHGLMFGLEFLQALGFLLLLCQVGGKLRDPLLQQLLLLCSRRG